MLLCVAILHCLHPNQNSTMPKKEEASYLIEELTTYKNEFKFWRPFPQKVKPIIRQVIEPKQKPPPPAVQIDTQTHAPYNPSIYVPFDIYIEPRPIIDDDPRTGFEIKKLPDLTCPKKKNPSKTIMSPTVCVDDIEDVNDRKFVLDYTYTKTDTLYYRDIALFVPKPPNPPNTVVINDKIKVICKVDQRQRKRREDEECCCLENVPVEGTKDEMESKERTEK